MSRDRSDRDFIAETIPVFISEAQEQVAAFEQLMLELEADPQDRELLDALFRCAHTIKGSAGIFGLDRIVAFTHHVETLLDRLRDGRFALTPALGTLLLQSNDTIRALVATARQVADDDAATLAERAALVARLKAASAGAPTDTGDGRDPTGQAPGTRAGAASTATPDAPDGAAPAQAADAAPAAEGTRRWALSARFGPDTYRNGMDPLALLNYLRGLGRVDALACDLDAVPALDDIDAETCHLGFAFELETAASRDEIEAAFSFVRDDCELTITPVAATAGAPVAAPPPAGPGTAPATPAADPAASAAQAAPAEHAAPAATPADRETRAKPTSPRQATVDDSRFIRVQADRLDAVINLLGELVIAGAGAAMMARQTRQRGLIEANLQISRLIEEIRNGTLQLRMVPIGETFARFRRVVRDTAAELGKEVVLEINGGETEMDKSVVERITDPLTHLVRNALDHGLETPEQRVAAGKPAQGRIGLSARHEAGSIAITIEDDGRGIDRRKVLQRAWDRGLVPQGTVPADADIVNLVFEPGFSTADKVTNLSGRGVGMDVARRNIQALRGSLTLHSVEGRGSRMEIRLPLTLAIIDGFLVGVGSSRFILPLEAVVEVVEDRPTATALDARGRSVIELRGQVLPVVSLRRLYALDSPAPERTSIVVLQAGDRRFGVMVDQLLGQHQTVIKPLGRLFGNLRGMSGSSILGNGEVALIFDVNALGRLAADPPARPGRQEPSGSTRTTSTEGMPS